MICSLLCLWVAHVKCYPMTVAVSLAPLPSGLLQSHRAPGHPHGTLGECPRTLL